MSVNEGMNEQLDGQSSNIAELVGKMMTAK